MMVNEFAFAISTVHFPTLGKWIKAISEVEADGATENTSPKQGCLFWPKMQYHDLQYDTRVRYNPGNGAKRPQRLQAGFRMAPMNSTKSSLFYTWPDAPM